MTLVHNALAGGLTGLVSTLASCPIELVKCRTQGMLEIVTKPASNATGGTVAANTAIRFQPFDAPTVAVYGYCYKASCARPG